MPYTVVLPYTIVISDAVVIPDSVMMSNAIIASNAVSHCCIASSAVEVAVCTVLMTSSVGAVEKAGVVVPDSVIIVMVEEAGIIAVMPNGVVVVIMVEEASVVAVMSNSSIVVKGSGSIAGMANSIGVGHGV